MTTKPSGYGTIDIGGSLRGFHVGTAQAEIFSSMDARRDAEGRPMSLQAYSDLFELDALRTLSFGIGDFRDFVYSALVSGAQIDGLEVDFTHKDVGFWLDEADNAEAAKPMRELVRQYKVRYDRQQERAKNAPAPTPATKAGPKPKPRTSK